MSGLLKLFIAVTAGVALGYLSAVYVADGHVFSDVRHLGAWKVWPRTGREDVSPYSRLHFLVGGSLPPSHFNRLEFEARNDDDGNPLRGGCSYSILASAPPSRWWAVTLYPRNAESAGKTGGMSEISSRTALHLADGSFRISVSPFPRPGNWLRAPRDGRFLLVFRLFGPTPLVRERLLSRPPASIVREECS